MSGLEDFIDACRKGHVAAARDWIARGRRINEPGSGKTTALMAAAERGRIEIVNLLVDAGADVCFRGSGGWTALMLAARGGHREVVEHLLNAGADPSSETILRDTAHSLALANGKMRVAQLLEKAGSTVNAKALHDVAHAYVVQEALTTRHYTPGVREAAANKAENLRPRLESIIAAGAQGGDYALWEAAKYRQRDTVRMLLAAKANPNAAPHGTSALSMACENKDLVTAQLLLDAGADPNFGGKTDEPLFVAIKKNSRQLVTELIRRGANVNVQRPRGITPLLLATSENNLPLMRILLDAGAHPNLPGAAEIGPAPRATVTRERIEDSIYEIKTTHVPSAPEAANVTPLIVAARRNFRDSAKLLLKHGADAEFKDAEGMTALAWAKKLRHSWTQRILLTHGADASASVEGSLDNALLTAARKGNLARVRELLAQGANANAHIDSADKRRTALGEAAENGSAKVIDTLLKAGAEVDKPTGELLRARRHSIDDRSESRPRRSCRRFAESRRKHRLARFGPRRNRRHTAALRRARWASRSDEIAHRRRGRCLQTRSNQSHADAFSRFEWPRRRHRRPFAAHNNSDNQRRFRNAVSRRNFRARRRRETHSRRQSKMSRQRSGVRRHNGLRRSPRDHQRTGQSWDAVRPKKSRWLDAAADGQKSWPRQSDRVFEK
jgi:ankyrin repeat protein